MVARKAKSVSPLVDAQLALASQFQEEPALVESVKRYVHTGETTIKNEPRTFAIVQLLTAGVPVITIAERMGASPHTVRAMRDAMRDGGKLAQFKQRAQQMLERLFVDVMENLQVLAVRGEISAHDLSVLAGILADKTGAGQAGPAQVIEHRHVLRVDRAQADAMWSALASADVQSAKSGDIEAEIVQQSSIGSGSGSGSALLTAPAADLDASQPTGAEPLPPGSQTPGGGGAPGAPGSAPDISITGEN